MERVHETPTNANARRVGAAFLLASSMAAAATSGMEAKASPSQAVERSSDWQLDWKDDFNGSALSAHWKVMDNTSVNYDRFSQYRDFAVTVRDGKLVITVRRHCVAPGEEMSLSNAQVDACPAWLLTEYSTGRVEQVVADIEDDYRVDVKFRAPKEKGARVAAWMNNIEDNPGGLNDGYCIEGSQTPTKELDLYEGYGDAKVRASHHAFCKDGNTPEVARVARFKDGWMNRAHVASVQKVERMVTFSSDGEQVPISGTKGERFADKPRDFPEITLAEYLQADAYPQGMIFDARVFEDENASNPLFRRPDSTEPFAPKEFVIDWIKKYKMNNQVKR